MLLAPPSLPPTPLPPLNIKKMPRVRQGIKVMPPRWWNGKTGSPFLITSLSSPRPPIFRLFVKLSKIHIGKPLLVEFQLNAFLTDRAAMKKIQKLCNNAIHE